MSTVVGSSAASNDSSNSRIFINFLGFGVCSKIPGKNECCPTSKVEDNLNVVNFVQIIVWKGSCCPRCGAEVYNRNVSKIVLAAGMQTIDK